MHYLLLTASAVLLWNSLVVIVAELATSLHILHCYRRHWFTTFND